MTAGRPRKRIQVPADALPQQAYFTVEEVAQLTGYHIHTIQARLRDGTLKGKKLGGTWRIYREALTGRSAKAKVEADLNLGK